MNKTLISYAQNREDIILSGFFEDVSNGFYIDVGANDPVHHSVTKHFYDQGWTGINVEPIPVLYKRLKKARPRDINLQIGIGEKKGITKFNYYPQGDGLSTFSDNMANQYKKHETKVTRKVEILKINIEKLSDVLAEHADGKVINFMKIDVEGFEASVINSNDWNKFRPQVLCIEANHLFDDWQKTLEAKKYMKVFFDGVNDYYVAQEADFRAKQFSYVNTIIGGSPVYYEMADKIEEADKYDELKEQNQQLVDMNRNNIKRIEDLEHEVNRPKSIKESLKNLARAVHNRNLKFIDGLKPNYSGNVFQLSDKTNAKVLLQSLHDYDLDNEKALISHMRLKALPYFICSKSYSFMVVFFKKLEHLLRSIIHKARNR